MRRRAKRRRGLLAHLERIGATNRLALYLVAMLAGGLIGGYRLARLSIATGYMGSLLCWTVVFTPIGTAISIVLAKVVDKSKAENTAADGTGIKFAAAQANGFAAQDDNSI